MGSSIDQVVGKVQALVKAKPELQSSVAEKLEQIIGEFEQVDISSKPASGAGGDDFATLTEGFKTFKKNIYDKHPDLTKRLKAGQWPTFMIISCADSRVDPGVVLQLKPGDAFIIRNVANLVPKWEEDGYPSIGSAVEYAVLHLKVKHIIVMGHRLCGGVKALYTMVPEDGKYSTDFIEKWVAIGKPARETVKNSKKDGESEDAILKVCEQECVKNSVQNLLTYPFVKEAVSEKKLGLHGGYYDHVEGTFKTWEA